MDSDEEAEVHVEEQRRIGSICDDETWRIATQQAASADQHCSMEGNFLMRTVGDQLTPGLTLEGFTCGGNRLGINPNGSREASLTYQPPMLINQDSQQIPGPQEDWFRPEVLETAQAFFNDDGRNKNFILHMRQTFMQWAILGTDITHDIDEDKPSDRCRDILFQRWVKQLCTVDVTLHDVYLRWISSFFAEFLPSDIWGKINSQPLTFYNYVIMGGPDIAEASEDYEPGQNYSLGDIKDALTDGLTTTMYRNGRPFVSIQTGANEGLQARIRLEKPTAQEAMDISTEHNIIDAEKVADLVARGAEQFSPQNSGVFTHNRTRFGLDAAKRQLQIRHNRPSNISGMTPPTIVSVDKTHANIGDSAPSKPIPGQELQRRLPTRNEQLMGMVEDGGSVLLQNNFMSNRRVTRRNQIDLQSVGGSTDPLEIFGKVRTALINANAEFNTFSEEAVLDIASGLPPGRREKIVENCDAMVEADQSLIRDTEPRDTGGRAKKPGTIKDDQEKLTAQIQSVHNARSFRLDSKQALPTLSEEEESLYRQEGKHSKENSMRRVMRPHVLATVNNRNAPNIVRIDKESVQGLEKFHGITPSNYYFLVQVTERNGHYFITYNRNGQQVTYYPTGRIPPDLIQQMIIRRDGEPYLPLATVLVLDEGIRFDIASNIFKRLNDNSDGKVFIKAMLDSLTEDPETILKIFDNHKEAFFAPLTHQKQHAHIGSIKKGGVHTPKEYKHLGSTTGTHHLASIANELFTNVGGEFMNQNLTKVFAQQGGLREIVLQNSESIVIKILMAIMTLQQQEGVEREEEKSQNLDHLQINNSCDIGSFIYNGIYRDLFTRASAANVNPYLNSSTMEHLSKDMRKVFSHDGIYDEMIQALMEHEGDIITTGSHISSILMPMIDHFLNKAPDELHGMYIMFAQEWIKSNMSNLIEKLNHCVQMKVEPGVFAHNFLSSQGETETTSVAPEVSSQGLIFDPRARIGLQETDFPVLLEITRAVISSDSNINIRLTCNTSPMDSLSTSQSVRGRVSVKKVRILDYNEFQRFCDAIESGKGKKTRMTYIESCWRRKVGEGPDFGTTFGVALQRRRKDVVVGDDDDDDDDDDEEGKGTSAVQGFNVRQGPGFSRKNNGLSHNKLTADQGPRALEAVYKNIATMCLMVEMDPERYEDIKTILIQNSFNEAIIKAGAAYCLQSTTIEGLKTGGDLLQVVQLKIMGMLFSIVINEDGIISVENFGFISFDRIATIIGAIFQVPSLFMSAKARNHAYGGLNMIMRPNTTYASVMENKSLMPRMRLFERALDWCWLGEIAGKRCKRLHSILIAVINILSKQINMGLEENWTDAENEELIKLLRDIVSQNVDALALIGQIESLMENLFDSHMTMISSVCRSSSPDQMQHLIVSMNASRKERGKCFAYINERLRDNQIAVNDFCNEVGMQDAIRDQLADIEPLDEDDAEEQQVQPVVQQQQAGPVRFIAGTIEDHEWVAVKLNEVSEEIRNVEDFLLHAIPLNNIRVLRQQAQTSNKKGAVADEDNSSKRMGAEPRQKRRTMLKSRAQLSEALQLRIAAKQALNSERRSTESMIRNVRRILNNKSLEEILKRNRDPVTNDSLFNKLQSLLERLMAHLTSLGPEQTFSGGGSRKRRHRRRKTRRNKKKRKKKTIKRHRKKGRKTRRK